MNPSQLVSLGGLIAIWQRILFVALVKTAVGAHSLELWNEISSMFFVGFYWIWFFFCSFFCGGAKKGYELLRSIDEVNCNQTASNSFHTVIGVLVPLGSKSFKFPSIF